MVELIFCIYLSALPCPLPISCLTSVKPAKASKHLILCESSVPSVCGRSIDLRSEN